METIVNALLPIAALLFVGSTLRRTGFLDRSFWDQAENLAYTVLMPLMLVRTIGGGPLIAIPWGDIVIVVYVTILIAAALMIGGYLMIRRPRPGPVFTSVFQGGVRMNTYIALGLAEALYGADGLAVAGLVAGFMIVLINVLCIGVMSSVLHGAGFSLRKVIFELARNPLILGCLAGGLINVSDVTFPVWIDSSLSLIARMALPVALLCVGASLRLSRLKGDLKPALISSAVQLLAKPGIAFAVTLALGLPPLATGIAIVFMSVPTAASSYVLAKKLGGDSEAMATIITFQTLIAFATLSVTLPLLP